MGVGKFLGHPIPHIIVLARSMWLLYNIVNRIDAFPNLEFTFKYAPNVETCDA